MPTKKRGVFARCQPKRGGFSPTPATHTDLTLYKIVPRIKSFEWRQPSAIWGLRGIPGLLIVCENRSDSLGLKSSGWQVHKRGTELEPYIDPDPLADRVYAKLQEQIFPTRREVVQAVEMALVIIKAEEDRVR